MYNVKDLVAKGKRDYNTTYMFVSKGKLFIIDEATFKKKKLITGKSCMIRCQEVEDRGLSKWNINCEMIEEKFPVGILLVSYMPSMLSWQRLQCKAITNTLNMRRQRDS